VGGVLARAVRERGRDESVPFLVGLVVAGFVAALAHGPGTAGWAAPAPLLAAGLLVGFGARLGGGCTSGHGVCGLSRLQARSLVATLVFMATGVLTVLVLSRVAPHWGVR
jgi:uncharacterized membrane protein YedE/YeeE